MWLIVAASLAAKPACSAETKAETIGSAFSLRWENDTFGGTDENYTNGISLALTRKGGGLIGGVWNLFGEPEGERFATYELAQLQFTPMNLSLPNPNPNDRPYAGLLYLGVTTYLQREDSLHGLKLFVGTVGPASLAEETQRFTHKTLSYTLPKGWAHQIKNEPIINLLYEYRHKFSITPRDSAIGVELIPVGGAMLGNYLVQGQAEAQLRVGYHLPDDFGATNLRGLGYLPFPRDDLTHHAWGIYAYAGGGMNLVAWNITLDGNTIAESRSVGKRLLLPAGEFGAALWSRWFQMSFSYIMWGKEFTRQQKAEDFGSVLLSWYFM